MARQDIQQGFMETLKTVSLSPGDEEKDGVDMLWEARRLKPLYPSFELWLKLRWITISFYL